MKVMEKNSVLMLASALMLAQMMSVCFGAEAVLKSPVWNLAEDLKAAAEEQVKQGKPFDFDAAGIYEKYISQRNWAIPRDDKHRRSPADERRSNASLSMSAAGYASEQLVQWLTVEIFERYPHIVKPVEVPHAAQDATARSRRYQTVLKFSTQNDTSHGSSIFINGGHHARELTSI